MGNKSKINAAYFISRLNECKADQLITRAEEQALLEDMSEILDKAVTSATEEINFYRRFGPTLLRAETDTYRRGYAEGALSYELWLLDGESHREGDKPAYLEYSKSGRVIVEEWLLKGVTKREGGKPVHISYDENGNIVKQY